MIEISWGTVVAFIALIGCSGPGFYYVGRMSKQVEQNTSSIKTIFKKLDVIHEFVIENGGKK